MHLLLTDILTCPHCGPDHGLILRADTMVDRRVQRGVLGCPDCRRNFPIEAGTAMLAPATGIADEPAHMAPPALRIAALLGLNAGSGFFLLAGPAGANACDVLELVADAQLIVLDTSAGGAAEECASPIVIGDSLPIRSSTLRGIWLSGGTAARWLDDAVRVLHSTGRLVLEPAPVDARERLEALGMRVMLHENETLLAVRAAT